MSALISAVRSGDLSRVLDLIKLGHSLEVENELGETALHVASKHGRLKVAELLLANGASYTHRTKEGFSPMGLAAAEGAVEILSLLLSAGDCAANYTGEHGPLHLAASHGRSDAVEFLVSSGFSVDARDGGGRIWTPLHYSSQEGHLDATRILLDHQADACYADQGSGTSPLELAAAHGHADIVQIMFDAIRDRRSNSAKPCLHNALCLACCYGQEDVARILVDFGINPMEALEGEDSPVSMAIEHGKTELAARIAQQWKSLND